jgi:hypothetical protein
MKKIDLLRSEVFELPKLLERLQETNHFWTLGYAVAIYQVSSTVRAIDFVAFDSFLISLAAFS